MTQAVRRGGVQFLLSAILLAPFAAPVLAEDFYEQQLHAAKSDLAAGRTAPAIDEFRVAAFGFLDRPQLLIETLVRLAVAQNAMDRTADVSQTVGRFLDIEQRFTTYATAALEPDVRAKFDSILLTTVSRSDLAAQPSLARLFRSDAAKVSDLPPERRAAAYEQGARKSPRDIEWPLAAASDALDRGVDQSAIAWARRALAIDGSDPRSRTVLVHALTRRGECREALVQLTSFPPRAIQLDPDLSGDEFVCLVRESRWNESGPAMTALPESIRTRADVARAIAAVNAHAAASTPRPQISAQRQPQVSAATPVQPALRPAPPATTTQPPAATPKPDEALASSKTLVHNGRYADATRVLLAAVPADPGRRDVRVALLEASALSRNWRVAVDQIAPLGRFSTGEEASMFYAASALYEVGRRDEARQLMQRARPRLTSTPFVDYYSRLILGTPK